MIPRRHTLFFQRPQRAIGTLRTLDERLKDVCVYWVGKTGSSRPEVFLAKGILEICSKFTGEYQCRSTISIKLQRNFIEITLRYGCSPVNLLHIFRTPFLKSTSGRLLLKSLSDYVRSQYQIKNEFSFLLLIFFHPLYFPYMKCIFHLLMGSCF